MILNGEVHDLTWRSAKSLRCASIIFVKASTVWSPKTIKDYKSKMEFWRTVDLSVWIVLFFVHNPHTNLITITKNTLEIRNG